MCNKLLSVVFICILLTGCKQDGWKGNVVDIDSIDLTKKERVLNELDTIGYGIPIFYNMYLSVELTSLFQTAGAVFTKDILNSYNNVSHYMSSYKKAMNIGVYAVDLSYARAFEQFEVAGRYFTAMQILSEEIGIPQNYFEFVARRFERNMTNKDSLIVIANEVYHKTEQYLKENERFATVSAIIMAGWIEAIYVGTHIAIESRNIDIIDRLMEQKYSLNNLLIMLSEFNKNEIIKEYISYLSDLRGVFDSIDIDIQADFDKSSPEGIEQLNEWVVQLKVLQKGVEEIRVTIID